MTLASKTTKPSPEISRVTPTQHGESTPAEPSPPTLLRLPRLQPTVATQATPSPQTLASESAQRAANDEPADEPVDAQRATVRGPLQDTVQANVSKQPNPVASPASPLPSWVQRFQIRDLNIAAWVDRVATRKTLSAALVVVAALAIWMPRSNESQNTTASLPHAASHGDEASDPFPLSEGRIDEPGALTANSVPSSDHEFTTLDHSVDNPPRQPRFKPEFSVAAAPMMSPPIEPVSHETTDAGSDAATYVMDPLASQANEQIRRMDATYADLPSVAAMDTNEFEFPRSPIASDEVARPFLSDAEAQTGTLNLVKSRTPNPIHNWVEYLPPASAQDLAGQTVGSSAPSAESSTASQSVAAANEAGSVRTTDSPVAPDFGFALPGGEELIDADAHVAMPPRDGAGQVQTR